VGPLRRDPCRAGHAPTRGLSMGDRFLVLAPTLQRRSQEGRSSVPPTMWVPPGADRPRPRRSEQCAAGTGDGTFGRPTRPVAAGRLRPVLRAGAGCRTWTGVGTARPPWRPRVLPGPPRSGGAGPGCCCRWPRIYRRTSVAIYSGDHGPGGTAPVASPAAGRLWSPSSALGTHLGKLWLPEAGLREATLPSKV
jgi:hypothetical protein